MCIVAVHGAGGGGSMSVDVLSLQREDGKIDMLHVPPLSYSIPPVYKYKPSSTMRTCVCVYRL